MSLFKLRLFNLRYMRFYSAERQYSSKAVSLYRIKQQEHLTLNKVLDNNENVDNINWAKIREELFHVKLAITEHNIDSIIVDRCYNSKNHTAVYNYIEYLLATDQKPNIAIVSKFFRAIHATKGPLTEKETKMLFKLYDDIRAKMPVLDPQTAQACIMALCRTSRWKEYEDLLDMAVFNEIAPSRIYAVIVETAFNNDEPNIGWELIKNMPSRGLLCQSSLESYQNYCIRNSKNTEELESLLLKMIEFWSGNDIFPDFEVVKSFGNQLQDTGRWNMRKAEIKLNGICSECGYKLPNFHLSEEEFDLLQKEFYSKVLMGSDVYQNTTPQELECFTKFVESTKPYDVVIDGLNVAYSVRMGTKTDRIRQLANVLSGLIQKKQKVFILGRQHMGAWHGKGMEYVKENAHLFLANDVSRDDPFILHAALASGVQTHFVSGDLMRQHKFILRNDNLRKIFRRWQLSRQIIPVHVGGAQNKQLLLEYPPKFLHITQVNSNGDWHIAYNPNGHGTEHQPSYKSQLWMCVTKKKNSD